MFRLPFVWKCDVFILDIYLMKLLAVPAWENIKEEVALILINLTFWKVSYDFRQDYDDILICFLLLFYWSTFASFCSHFLHMIFFRGVVWALVCLSFLSQTSFRQLGEGPAPSKLHFLLLLLLLIRLLHMTQIKRFEIFLVLLLN